MPGGIYRSWCRCCTLIPVTEVSASAFIPDPVLQFPSPAQGLYEEELTRKVHASIGLKGLAGMSIRPHTVRQSVVDARQKSILSADLYPQAIELCGYRSHKK